MSSDNNPVIVIHHAMAGCSEPACGGKILCVEGQGSLWSFFFCSTETRLCSPWLSVHPAASLLLWAKWAPEGLSDRFCSPSLCKHGTQILLFWLILTCRPCQLGGTSCNLSLLGSPVSLIASTLYFPNWLSPISTMWGVFTCTLESGWYLSPHSEETILCAVYNSHFAFLWFPVGEGIKQGGSCFFMWPCSYQKSCFSNQLEIHVFQWIFF